MHSGPDCAPDTARLAVPVDIPSPSSTSLVPARGGSAETQRPLRRRGKSLAYRLSSYKRSLAGGALNAPYFLIPYWPPHLCSAGPVSWLSSEAHCCARRSQRARCARLGHVRVMVLKRPGESQLTPTTPRGAVSAAARPCACPRPVPNPGVGSSLSSHMRERRQRQEAERPQRTYAATPPASTRSSPTTPQSCTVWPHVMSAGGSQDAT